MKWIRYIKPAMENVAPGDNQMMRLGEPYLRDDAFADQQVAAGVAEIVDAEVPELAPDPEPPAKRARRSAWPPTREIG